MTTIIAEPRHMGICIVDDVASEGARMQALLAEGGFDNVATATSLSGLLRSMRAPQQGLALATLDLVVLSDNVRDATVSEACRTLAAQSQAGDLAVVLVTDGDGNEPEIGECAPGALDVMRRNIGGSEFLRRVGLVLNLQRERRWRRVREDALETELAERKVMEARLKYLVDHDDLTGLPNRRRLDQALELAVIRARNFHRTNALLYLDLDQFKVVNDTAGHDVGDRLLIDVANKIRNCLQPGQLVARIGADEFAILLEHVEESEAMEFAESLRVALSDFQFRGGNTSHHVAVSIGLVLNNPDEEISASELLARADQACYLAKNQGRNTVYKFSGEDEELHALRSDAMWMPALRKALSDDQFFMVFQPVMRLPQRRISHYEALIRMRGDNGEVYTPVDFIPAAERMGLIHQIDLWVVEHVLDFLAGLGSDQAGVSMSVNLSGHAFQDPALLPLIKQKLDMSWLSASRVMFEITETAAVTNYSETRKMVARLRALGCRFALDDFGAGFSSFSYIKNFPVDMLKIDGSFIANLINDQTDQLLVRSMIEVAHSLGKKVIAEYVENAETLEKLAEFGVDYVQGHYVAQPSESLVDEKWQAPNGPPSGFHTLRGASDSYSMPAKGRSESFEQ